MRKSDKERELLLAAYYIKLEELVREYVENGLEGHHYYCEKVRFVHEEPAGIWPKKVCTCGYDALAQHIEERP